MWVEFIIFSTKTTRFHIWFLNKLTTPGFFFFPLVWWGDLFKTRNDTIITRKEVRSDANYLEFVPKIANIIYMYELLKSRIVFLLIGHNVIRGFKLQSFIAQSFFSGAKNAIYSKLLFLYFLFLNLSYRLLCLFWLTSYSIGSLSFTMFCY